MTESGKKTGWPPEQPAASPGYRDIGTARCEHRDQRHSTYRVAKPEVTDHEATNRTDQRHRDTETDEEDPYRLKFRQPFSRFHSHIAQEQAQGAHEYGFKKRLDLVIARVRDHCTDSH